MKLTNVMIIGLGPHAKRIYCPICMKDGKKYGFKLVHGVELLEKKNDVEKYFKEKNFHEIEIKYLTTKEKTYGELHPKVEKDLNRIIKEKKIKGVIISTEPLAHSQYAKWALQQGLHILMDKPMSTAENITSSLKAVESIKKDYEELEECYKKARTKNKKLIFSLMAQRRYHPAFIKMRELVQEVFKKTNCPITSIQSYHGDGQWRMPTEIVEQSYHPYNQGYGKCSHSGYHSIDIVSWLIRSVESNNKYIDNVDVFTNFVTPVDFIHQLNISDYKKLFKNFDTYNKYTEK
ncbi:Gfo/Idh/MocA family oxidoreductase, partial [bacterium]|nr:Gfo/Idh/MocA family oxidoreductase [bacterium]